MLALLFLGGCLKSPQISEQEGETVAPETVMKTLVDAWNEGGPVALNVGDFVAIDRTQKIQDVYEDRVYFRIGFSVLSKTDSEDGTQNIFEIAQQTEDITDGQSKLSSLIRQVSLDKKEPLQVLNNNKLLRDANFLKASSNLEPFSIDILASYAGACLPVEGFQISCFNLKREDKILAPPELVQQRENCGGLTNCKMHTQLVSFDRKVVWTDATDQKEKSETMHFDIRLSPEAPFLARVIESCYRGLVAIPNSDQRVLVRICNHVRDFR